MKSLSVFLATLFGTGYFPFAPGTVGSLFAAFTYLALPEYFFSDKSGEIYLFLIVAALFFISVKVSSEAEKTLGHDSGKIVIDEFVGYYASVLFLPHHWITALVALIFFRIFDIVKPSPIYETQKLKSGWGITVDDVAAGIFANICTYFFLIMLVKQFNITV